MTDLFAVAVNVNHFGLPIAGIVALVASKLSQGAAADFANRCLLAVLGLVVAMTIHGLVSEQASWLVHAVTLGVILVGTAWEPGQR